MAVAASDEDAEIAERLAALRERLTEVSAFTKHARESLTPARLQRARDEASSLSRTRREDAASPAGVGARRPGRALYFESADAAPRAHSRPSRSDPALDLEDPPLSPLRGHIRAARAFPDHHHRHHHEQHPSRRAPHRRRRDHHQQHHQHHHSDLDIDPDPDRDPSVALGLDDDDDDDRDNDHHPETRETRDVTAVSAPAVSAPAISAPAPAITAVSASAAQSILERDRLHARVVRAEERAEAAAAEAALWRRRVDQLERDARETRRRREDAAERLRRVAEDAATLAETTRARGGDGETVAAALETLAAALGGGTRGGGGITSGDGGEPSGEAGAGPVLLLASSSVVSSPSGGRLALPAPRGVVAARAAAEARAAAAEVAGALEHALATAGCPSAAADLVRDALKQLTRKVDDAVVAAVGEGH